MSSRGVDAPARWLALVTACLGMMAAFLVITASVAILAPMARALHTSSTSEVWVVSGVPAIGALSYGVIRGGNDGYATTAIVACFCAAAVSTAAFVVVERNSAAPMLHLPCCQRRGPRVGGQIARPADTPSSGVAASSMGLSISPYCGASRSRRRRTS